MSIDVHLHGNNPEMDRKLAEILRIQEATLDVIGGVVQQVGALMSKADDLKAGVAAVSAGLTSVGDSLTNVAADIDRIKAQIAGGLTATEADGVVKDLSDLQAKVTAVSTAASDLAASNPDPEVPPVEG